jgi:Fe-only nitrogenase accessory protein AnfO
MIYIQCKQFLRFFLTADRIGPILNLKDINIKISFLKEIVNIMDKIAVIMNKCKNIASFEEDAIISVFENQSVLWHVLKRIPVRIDFKEDLSSLRKEIENLIAELGDCKIIAGKTISGLVYHMLDKRGFDIFEVEQFRPELLDEILSDATSTVSEKAGVTEPVETGVPGIYFLDLVAMQLQNPEVSSKMAIQPFLTDTPFLELHVICRHLPPWLENFVSSKGMKLDTEKIADEKVQVKITKLSC